MSLPKAVTDQLLREMDRRQRHRHDSREGCRSINTDMQIVSRVGALPPLKVHSRGMVKNLNVNLLQGRTVQQILDEIGASQSHNLLSSMHSDTLADSVISGDLVYGDATPKWARLPKAADGKFLKLISGLPAWSDPPAGTEHNILSATHPDTLPDSLVGGDILYANNTPKLTRLPKAVDGKVLTLASGLPSWADSAGGVHNLLSATHSDTLADSVVAGDLIIGNATPKFARLPKESDGKFLGMVSGLPAWADAPTSTGLIAELLDPPAATSLTISGLDGDTHKFYKVVAVIKKDATAGHIYLRMNNDSGTNYDYDGYMILAGGFYGLAGTGVTSVYLNYQDSNNRVKENNFMVIEITIFAKSGVYRRCLVRSFYRRSFDNALEAVYENVEWKNSSDNLTSLVFVAEAGQGNIGGAGTNIRVYKFL